MNIFLRGLAISRMTTVPSSIGSHGVAAPQISPAVTPSSGRLAQAALGTRDARNEAWFCPVNEARDYVALPIPLDYLSKSILYRHDVSVGRGGHVGVGKSVFEDRTHVGELLAQFIGQAALLGFDPCT